MHSKYFQESCNVSKERDKDVFQLRGYKYAIYFFCTSPIAVRMIRLRCSSIAVCLYSCPGFGFYLFGCLFFLGGGCWGYFLFCFVFSS